MKIVVFAGGTGKRFWPVSRIKSPKQFLPVGGEEPLLKMRYDLLREGFSTEDIFISTGKQYEKEISELLPDLPKQNLILEPEMRDTGPAVTLAVSYINKLYPGEVISIQWSDHIIKKPDVFIETLKFGDEKVRETGKTIFITVPARFPSPHRGYINFGEKLQDVNEYVSFNNFTKFVEKPTVEVAKKYIASGKFGWNPGYWILKGDLYLKTVAEFWPEHARIIKDIVDSSMDPTKLEEFKNLDKNSADYMFAEKVRSDEAFVLLTDMGWSDVGEWIALKEALEETPESNVIKGNVEDMGSRDSIIHNYDDSKLVSTIGLEGFVVVNTKDVVAIFKKEDNSKLKEYLKKLEAEGKTEYL